MTPVKGQSINEMALAQDIMSSYHHNHPWRRQLKDQQWIFFLASRNQDIMIILGDANYRTNNGFWPCILISWSSWARPINITISSLMIPIKRPTMKWPCITISWYHDNILDDWFCISLCQNQFKYGCRTNISRWNILYFLINIVTHHYIVSQIKFYYEK